MAKNGKRAASIFERWREIMEQKRLTPAALAREIGEDEKYIKDLFNDEVLAKQVHVVKKIEKRLECRGMFDPGRYQSHEQE